MPGRRSFSAGGSAVVCNNSLARQECRAPSEGMAPEGPRDKNVAAPRRGWFLGGLVREMSRLLEGGALDLREVQAGERRSAEEVVGGELDSLVGPVNREALS